MPQYDLSLYYQVACQLVGNIALPTALAYMLYSVLL